jgi:hypothetical protein
VAQCFSACCTWYFVQRRQIVGGTNSATPFLLGLVRGDEAEKGSDDYRVEQKSRRVCFDEMWRGVCWRNKRDTSGAEVSRNHVWRQGSVKTVAEKHERNLGGESKRGKGSGAGSLKHTENTLKRSHRCEHFEVVGRRDGHHNPRNLEGHFSLKDERCHAICDIDSWRVLCVITRVTGAGRPCKQHPLRVPKLRINEYICVWHLLPVALPHSLSLGLRPAKACGQSLGGAASHFRKRHLKPQEQGCYKEHLRTEDAALRDTHSFKRQRWG